MTMQLLWGLSAVYITEFPHCLDDLLLLPIRPSFARSSRCLLSLRSLALAILLLLLLLALLLDLLGFTLLGALLLPALCELDSNSFELIPVHVSSEECSHQRRSSLWRTELSS